MRNSGFAFYQCSVESYHGYQDNRFVFIAYLCTSYLESMFGGCAFGIWYNVETMITKD